MQIQNENELCQFKQINTIKTFYSVLRICIFLLQHFALWDTESTQALNVSCEVFET